MKPSTAFKISDYELEKIDESKTSEIISSLEPEAAFSYWIDHFSQLNEEDSNSYSLETLRFAVEETFKRLAFELYYRLQSVDESISLSGLLLLSSHLEKAYQSQISEGPDFEECCDWDSLITAVYEVLAHFHSPSKKLVGTEYFEVEAINSAVLQESDLVATQRITEVIDQIRIRFFRNNIIQRRIEVFEALSDGLVEEFVQFRNTFNKPKELLNHLIECVQEYIDQNYDQYSAIVKNVDKINKEIPNYLPHFNSLLESQSSGIQKALKVLFQKNSDGSVESIWREIIAIAIESIEETDETVQLELPPLFGTSKPTRMLN